MNFDYPPGATPLDPDEIAGLKLAHITTQGELNRWEQDNILEAQEWVERRKKGDLLNEEFICKLHEKMYGKVWQWAGEFRRTNKNIGVEWQYVPIRLRELLDNVNYWIANNTYPPEEIAYRFHHLLVQIHLFPNGNGRHSRMITDILLVEAFGIAPFTWGQANLQEANEVRQRYIEALKAADNHNYELLAEFVRT